MSLLYRKNYSRFSLIKASHLSKYPCLPSEYQHQQCIHETASFICFHSRGDHFFSVFCTVAFSTGSHVMSHQPCKLTLSLPRVINFKFPLHPHQRYYRHTVWRTWLSIAHSYEKWLYYHFSLNYWWEFNFWTWEWKGWRHQYLYYSDPFFLSQERVSCQSIYTRVAWSVELYLWTCQHFSKSLEFAPNSQNWNVLDKGSGLGSEEQSSK